MDLIPIDKADYSSHYQEFETDLIFDADTDIAIKYAVCMQKLESASQAYWHAGAVMKDLYETDGEACYAKLSEMGRWAIPTLRQIMHIYETTGPYAIPGMSFWIHKEAAALPEPKRGPFLRIADDECWTVEIARAKSREWRGLEPKGTSPQQNNNKDSIPAEFSEVDFEADESAPDHDRLQKFLGYVMAHLTELGEKAECTYLLTVDWSKPETAIVVAEPEKILRVMPKPLESQCLEYGLSIELSPDQCQAFYDYQVSKGWKVNNSPMKNWEAAMRTWKRNYDQRKPTNGKPIDTRTHNDIAAEAVRGLHAGH